MQTMTFTTHLDTKLKIRLKKIAKYENRTTSYVANYAIQKFVEEHEATHEATRHLIGVGLKLVEKGVSISESTIDTWLSSPEDTPFPKPDTFKK